MLREMQLGGEPIPMNLQVAFGVGEELLYARVRDLFGGRLRWAITHAAPIAPEILEFFYACGVPLFEGYGMTRDIDDRVILHAGGAPLRHRRAPHSRV